MNKSDLIKTIAAKTELTNKQANATYNALTSALVDALKAGEAVQIMGFGTFELKTRPARTGKNPRTGEAVEIAEKRVPVFKPGKALKDAVQ